MTAGVFRYGPPVQSAPANYTEVVKKLRRRLKPYSVDSIIDTCLAILDHWRGKGLEEIKSAPWLTLLIVKLVLEDTAIELHGSQPCPASAIDEIRADLWNTPTARENADSPSVYLMLRSIVHTQMLFQQHESMSFMRWPALIGRLPAQHVLRAQFETEFGCDPDTFIGIVFAAYSAVMQQKTFIMPNYWDPLRPLYGNAIDRFLERFSKDATELRTVLRNELHKRIYEQVDGRLVLKPGAGVRPATERIEFPWLSNYPLLRHPSGRLAVWHRLVFARGMEDGVHNVLSSLGQAYTDPFSKVFEQYVIELIGNAGLQHVGEDDLRGGAANNPAVEALIHADGCNVLVESKMSLFPDRVLISDRGPEVFMKLRRVREAMVQGWRVGDNLRNGTIDIPGPSGAQEDFLLIVTSRQLNICSGMHFARMFGDDVAKRINPESRFGGASEVQLARLPLKNIFILSIEEFEHLSGAVSDGSVELVPFLRKAAADNADPRTSSMNFDQILRERVSRWVQPRLIRATRLRAERRLRQWLTAAQSSAQREIPESVKVELGG